MQNRVSTGQANLYAQFTKETDNKFGVGIIFLQNLRKYGDFQSPTKF